MENTSRESEYISNYRSVLSSYLQAAALPLFLLSEAWCNAPCAWPAYNEFHPDLSNCLDPDPTLSNSAKPNSKL